MSQFPSSPVSGKQVAGSFSGPTASLDSQAVAEFERCIREFEDRWSAADEFETLLPRDAVNLGPDLFRELACIDMEFRWQAGQEPKLESYLAVGQARGLIQEQLQEIGFEDYRLRSRHGQPADPAAYAERWNWDVSAWPKWEASSAKVAPRSTAELPSLGSDFHGYHLVGILGRGAFGCVYLARQAGLANRFVVLKVTPAGAEEPQLLAELQHTHIVPIYSLQQDAKWQSICMPFLGLVTLAELRPEAGRLADSGQALLSTVAAHKADTIAASARTAGEPTADLGELLQPDRHCRLPAIKGLDCERTLLWMFARVAEALAFAHSRGVVHGDIKPANILVSDDGNPLLLDFHLASRIQGSHHPEHVGGTLPYMSPQQLRALEQGQKPAASCDLFSLGVVMFELLGGRLPYVTRPLDRDSIAAMISEREQPPPSLSQITPAISVDVVTIIESCLVSEQAGGYRSLRQLQEDLDAHLAHRPLLHARNRSLRERVRKWTRRHPVLASTWSLTGLFLLLAVVTGSLVAGRLQSARRLEAEVSSQQFVRELASAIVPLTVPGLGPRTVQTATNQLAEQVVAHYQAADYPGPELLSEQQKSAESAQLSSASFWLTQSTLANAAPQPSATRQLAELESLEAVVAKLAKQVPPSLSTEFVSLQTTLQRAMKQDSKADFSALELLQPPEQPGAAASFSNEARILDAARAVRRGEAGLALSQLERVLGVDSDNYQAWLLKGHAWLLAGNRERASEAYSFCVALQPSSPWGWFQRGIVRLEQGELSGSRSDFDRCIELEPQEATAYLNRALAARAAGDLKAALSDLSRAIELGCGETRAWYLRSQVYGQLGQAEEAQRDQQAFLNLEPSDLKSWLARGLVRARANQPDLALQDFQAARRLVPDSVDAWQNIATVQSEMLKQLEKAADSLGEIIKLRPNDPIPLVTRGVLLGRMEARPAAHADVQNALRLRSDADLLFRAAGVYALTSRVDAEDVELALDLLRRAAFADPGLVLSRMEADTDLQPIRQHPEYQKVLSSLKLLAQPQGQSNEVKQ